MAKHKLTRPILTGKFWADLAERAIASAAGGALAVIGADSLFNAIEADWAAIGAVALGAAAFSVLKGLAALGVGQESASLAPNV